MAHLQNLRLPQVQEWGVNLRFDRTLSHGRHKRGHGQYIWSARQNRQDQVGATPLELKPIFARLGFEPTTWCKLVYDFDRMFHTVAGQPKTIDVTRGKVNQRPFRVARQTREMLTVD